MKYTWTLIIGFAMTLAPNMASAYSVCNAKLTRTAEAGFVYALPTAIRTARQMIGSKRAGVAEVCPYYANGPLEKAIWITFANQNACKIWFTEDWEHVYTENSFCN